MPSGASAQRPHRAAEIRYGRIPELERGQLRRLASSGRAQPGSRMLKEEVDAEDIAEVVARGPAFR
jgi:ATP-dependent Clp protease ATP-binding subunit ClpB